MIRFKNLDTSEDSIRLCCDIYFCGNISSISKPYGAMVWIDKDVETDESVTIKIEDNHDEKKKTTLSPKRKSRDFVFVVAAPRESMVMSSRRMVGRKVVSNSVVIFLFNTIFIKIRFLSSDKTKFSIVKTVRSLSSDPRELKFLRSPSFP